MIAGSMLFRQKDIPDDLRDFFEPASCGVCYVCHMVLVFRELRRTLRADGTLWLNLGDCYATGAGAVGDHPGGGAQGARWKGAAHGADGGNVGRRPHGQPAQNGRGEAQAGKFAERNGEHAGKHTAMGPMTQPNRMPIPGLKPKDLVMIPERVALALQADGWWVRSRIPWLKRNAMPESVTDRPANATEYVFLLSKSAKYFYDREAVKLAASEGTHARMSQNVADQAGSTRANGGVEPHRPFKAGGRTGVGFGHGYDKAPKPRYKSERKSGEPGSGIKNNPSFDEAMAVMPLTRNRRNSDWFFESWQGMVTDEDGDPLALVVNPAAFKEAHFATFPPKLIEPMVKAGTSERGVCGKCGAPWLRVVDAAYENVGNRQGNGPRSVERKGQEFGSAGFEQHLERVSNTAGWEPSCECYETEPLPEYPGRPGKDANTTELEAYLATCIEIAIARQKLLDAWKILPSLPARIADIFGGAGTTGLVADRLGRDCTLLEIKPEYADIARDRIVGDAPLFSEVK